MTGLLALAALTALVFVLWVAGNPSCAHLVPHHGGVTLTRMPCHPGGTR